jgi:KipI family sensor histidine kinase inhibitor
VNSTTQDFPMVNVRVVGGRAVLVEVADPLAWHDELLRRRAAGELVADDIVPGARTVLVDGVPDPARLAATLSGWRPASTTRTGAARTVEIPARFDGPDLHVVARHWHDHPDGVARRLRDTEFRVAFSGFAPGFGYLTGLPDELAVPRLADPRTRVPAGAIGLAGPYAGIYPTASPGGWLLVGQTDVRLFDVGARPPALLTPGTRVRFVS